MWSGQEWLMSSSWSDKRSTKYTHHTSQQYLLTTPRLTPIFCSGGMTQPLLCVVVHWLQQGILLEVGLMPNWYTYQVGGRTRECENFIFPPVEKYRLIQLANGKVQVPIVNTHAHLQKVCDHKTQPKIMDTCWRLQKLYNEWSLKWPQREGGCPFSPGLIDTAPGFQQCNIRNLRESRANETEGKASMQHTILQWPENVKHYSAVL